MAIWFGILGTCALGFLWMLWKVGTGRSQPVGFLSMLLLLISVLLGGIRMRESLNKSHDIHSGTSLNQVITLWGRVETIQEEEDRVQLLLKECQVRGNEGAPIQKIRNVLVWVQVHDWVPLNIGNYIEGSGELKLFDVARNPGGFHYRGYYQAMEIDFSFQADSIKVISNTYDAYRESLRQISKWAGDVLGTITEGRDTGIYQAALLGNRGELDGSVRALYQKNGIAHLLAISGLHLSLIGMGVHKVFRKSGMGYGWAGISGGFLVISYGILTGGSSSVIRATVMLLCGFLASYLGRTYDLLTALGLSAILILWEYPLLVTQAGVQLSFGAILGIGYVLPLVTSMYHREEGQRLPLLLNGFLVSLCIQVVTIPILLYHFFQIPTYGILLNLVVIPLMSYVVASGIAGVFLGSLWIGVGRFAVGIGHFILNLYEWLCVFIGKIPLNNLVLGQPMWWQICLYYSLLIFGCLYIERRKSPFEPWRRNGLLFCGVGLLLLLLPRPPSELVVTFLDVGQGDGIFFRIGKTTVLIDGGSSDEKKVGEYFLEPYLKSQGITTIDYAFVSHGDGDHISGLLYLLKEGTDIQIKNLMLPILGQEDEAYESLLEAAKKRESLVHWIGAGDTLTVEQVMVQCLYPDVQDIATDRNEQSMVLNVSYREFSMLLTGDMSQVGERKLLERTLKAGGNVQVLKVAHHGSRFSSSATWIAAINPMWAVVSYGDKNPYGHPHKEVRERLEEFKIPLYETAKEGAISLYTNGRRIRWSTYCQ